MTPDPKKQDATTHPPASQQQQAPPRLREGRGGIFQSAWHWAQSHLVPYDAVTPLHHEDPAFRSAHRLVLGLLAAFIGLGILFIILGLIDNKPTTASTGLVTAHRMVTMNWLGWFQEGVWWRNQQTPTPLPFTIHGLFFTLFGYSVHGILVLHTLVGAFAAWLLFRITARRFGTTAGLLATGLCLAMPLFLYVTFAGWTFVWATMFLLLAIDLSDRAVLEKRRRWFLLAGLALGCAGMSRPENYAAGVLFVTFAPFALRYRAAFLLVAFAYPLTQYVFNNVFWGDEPGLRILDDARGAMSYTTLFQEWFGSVHRNILNRNYSWALQWAILPVVILFGLPRHRLLTGVLAYFWVAFFAAYAMRRISFNHEGYYYAHVMLSTPFLAAGLAWLATRLKDLAARIGAPPQRAAAASMAIVLIVLAADRSALHQAYADRLFFRVPEPVQELRDQLVARLDDDDALVLDYFPEVSWMLAELEGNKGRSIYYYNTNVTGEPRPRLNAARKDIEDEELVAMNLWVHDNFSRWEAQNLPRYYVRLSNDKWQLETNRKNAMGHYRMFGLRAAADAAMGRSGCGYFAISPPYEAIEFANSDFFLYDFEPSGAMPPLLNESFLAWNGKDSLPVGWSVRPPVADIVTRSELGNAGPAATLHPQPDGATQLIYDKRTGFPKIVPGATICVEAKFETSERDKIMVLLGFKRTNGESYNVKLQPADKADPWKRSYRITTLPKDIEPGTMYVAITLREGATTPASVSEIIVRPVYVP